VPLSEAGPINEITPAYLRVLAKVGKTDGAGDVPLKVLAVAAEGSIGPYDEQEEKEAARRAREAQMRANKRTTGRGYNTPARGNSTLRELPSDPSDPGLLNYFSPYLTARAKAIYLPYLRFIAGHNPRLTRPEAGYIAAALLRAADALNVDPRLVVAVVVAESDFKPTETSRTNAQGLMQLMPSTAQILGVRNSYNPDENLRGGVTYLREQLDRFASKANPDGSMSDEQISLACAAYNAGPGAVKKYGGIPPYKETQRYIKRILALYHELCQ
jgi:soluble lytic murein transglycosylase-like protein